MNYKIKIKKNQEYLIKQKICPKSDLMMCGVFSSSAKIRELCKDFS